MWHWTGSTITYAFPTSASGMNASSVELSGFRAVSSTEQVAFRLALQIWDELIPQTLQQTTASDSNIEYAYSSTMGDSYAYEVSYSPPTASSSGNTWFSLTVGRDAWNNTSTATIGKGGFLTILHETGHALGLDHMGNYNAGNGSVPTPSSYQDSTVYSIMSYFGPSGPLRSSEVASADWISAAGVAVDAQTPMLDDVLAIQSIYGVSTTTRADNTVYGFACNITGAMAAIYNFTQNANPILTIFDSGGTDTLNLSGWSTPSKIFLEAGVYSSCNDMTNNIVIAYGCVIENAVGGAGSDQITGNSAANLLDGGAGNDTLAGGDGDDTLTGGTGNDALYGDAGSDTALFAGAFSTYKITANASGTLTVVSTTTGTDTLVNIEFLQFSDSTKPASQFIGTVTADTTAPLLSSLSPVDNATGVLPGANLVLTFNENIKAGSGNIVLYTGSGVVVQTIAITDTNQIMIDGSTLTINPQNDLAPGSAYYLTFPSGVIKDIAGNNFAGITGATAFNFSTQAAATADDYPWALNTTGYVSVNATGAKGVIGAPYDGDLFKISLVAGTRYVFDLARATGGLTDPYLQLFNATGDLITYDNDSGGTLNARIYFTANSSGNYFLGATDFAGGTGAYTLSATMVSNQVDDFAASTSTTGVLTIGAQSTGKIDFSGDSDWFKVTLQANVTYTFELDGSDGAGGTLGAAASGTHQPYLELFGSTGTYLKASYSGGAGGDPLMSFTPSAAGTYYLSASDLYDTGTGTYTLKGKAATTTTDDFAGTTSTTGVLPAVGQVSGKIDFAGDADWFKVTLTAGTSYTFELDGADGGGGTLGAATSGTHQPYLQLLGSTGLGIRAAYDGGAGGDPQITFVPATSGVYYLAAADLYDTGTGTYTLKSKSTVNITDDFSNTTATLGRLEIGANATGKIEVAGDEDWFRVTLQNGVTYRFELDGADGGGGTLGAAGSAAHQPQLTLLSANGQFIDSVFNGGTGGDPLLSFTAPEDGIYYLSASDLYGTGTGTYTLKASQVGTVSTAPVFTTGTGGDDVIIGGGGDDLLAGAAGNDTLSGGRGNDYIDGGSGTDVAIFTGKLSSYSISRNGASYTVQDRKGNDGTDILTDVEQLNFSDITINLTTQDLAATAGKPDVQRLIELYLAFFNRIPDADGMAYWIGQRLAGQSINSIADTFYTVGAQYTSQTGISTGMSNAAFIDLVYKNVLGRISGADAGGQTYWSAELASGRATRGSLVSAILDSAHSFKGDATLGYVANLLDNKITVGQTISIDWGLTYTSPTDAINYGMAIAAAITPTDTAAALKLVGISPYDISIG
jgi:Ca2+-binding RTX toxin-like protein